MLAISALTRFVIVSGEQGEQSRSAMMLTLGARDPEIRVASAAYDDQRENADGFELRFAHGI